MIEALFLDRDGIINEVVLRENCIGSPRSLAELKVREDFRLFYQKIPPDIPLFVVSNQPDIRRGVMSLESLHAISASILLQFPRLTFHYCMHDDRDDCSCRKPKGGLLKNLIEKYRLDPQNTLMIGDSAKDIEAGRSLGVKTLLLLTPYNQKSGSFPDFQVEALKEAHIFL